MGILYCCCEQAENMRCSVCQKYKAIKPDVIFRVPQWEKKTFKLQQKAEEEEEERALNTILNYTDSLDWDEE